MKKHVVMSFLVWAHTFYAASESAGFLSRLFGFRRADAGATELIAVPKKVTPCVDGAEMCRIMRSVEYGQPTSIASSGTLVALALKGMPLLPDGSVWSPAAIQEYDCSSREPKHLSTTPLTKQTPIQVTYTKEGALCWLTYNNGKTYQVRRPDEAFVDVPMIIDGLHSATIDSEAQWLVSQQYSESQAKQTFLLYDLNNPDNAPTQLYNAQAGVYSISLLGGSSAPNVTIVSAKNAVICKGSEVTQIIATGIPNEMPVSVPSNVGYAYNNAVFSPDGKYVYVVANNIVLRYEIETGALDVSNFTLNITTQPQGRLSAIDATGSMLAISDPVAGVLVMDTETMQVMGSRMKLVGNSSQVSGPGAVAMNFGTDKNLVLSYPENDQFYKLIISDVPYKSPIGGASESN